MTPKTLFAFILVLLLTALAGNAQQRIDAPSNSFLNIKGNLLKASPASEDDEKSGFLAVAYSLLLPGMGEWYAGDFSRGKYNLIADGVLWGVFAGVNVYGTWVRDDGRTFAAQRARVRVDGKDDEYFVNIGNYLSLADYNDRKLRDRNLAAVYNEDPAAGYQWNWDSNESRERYRKTRVLSDEMFNGSRFVVLALIANRVWSAIHAAMMVGDYNESVNPSESSLPYFNAAIVDRNGNPDGIRFDLSVRF